MNKNHGVVRLTRCRQHGVPGVSAERPGVGPPPAAFHGPYASLSCPECWPDGHEPQTASPTLQGKVMVS